MSVEIKEKSKTPKFKKGDKVIIKGGSHGTVLDVLSPTLYRIGLPDNCAFSYIDFWEDELTIAPRKFKVGDKVIIKVGRRKGQNGMIKTCYYDNNSYAIVFPFNSEISAYSYYQEEIEVISQKNVVNEIMAMFESERINPVSRIDRSRAGGWIDCEYYRETITLEQRDELYKKMGIE